MEGFFLLLFFFFTTFDWGTEIEFSAQPKKISWGEHKIRSPVDGSDVLTHKQDDSKSGRRRGRKHRVEDGRGNVSVLFYRVIIDFPSALQWKFSANTFCYNVRRKMLIS